MSLVNKAAGSDVFLQGKYLNLAVNGGGSIGSFASAPTGVYTDIATGYVRLGMWADFDGFGVGKGSTLSESLLKGTPVEGFSLGYSVGASQYVRTNHDQVGQSDVAGTVTSVSTATAAKAKWMGTTSEKIAIDQVTSLTENGKFVRFDIILTNGSAAAVSNVRYMRTADPDQGGAFTTENKIVQQGSGSVLVTAASASAQMFYYSTDKRAVVSSYGLDNTNPYSASAYDTPRTAGYSLKGDYSINLTFGVGTLAAGASTTLTFYTGLTDDLAATIAAISSATTTPLPTNSAPVAVDDLYSLVASASASGNVLINDKDTDGDALTSAIKIGPTNGHLTLLTNGTFNYAPKIGFVGTDSFVYTASDGNASAVATVKLVVAALPPVNTAPTAVDDLFVASAGACTTYNVLSNDKDANHDTLHALVKSGPANGTLALSDDGTFQYTANAGFSGLDSFTYTASDGVLSSVGTVKITVASQTSPTTPTVYRDSILSRAGTQDSSTSGDQVLTGPDYHNTFFVDSVLKSGDDRVTNFGTDDVLVTTNPLTGFAGGSLTLTNNSVKLDGTHGHDSIRLTGVDVLRSLGTTESGLSLYANAAVKPTNAVEGTLAADRLSGDISDREAETFFFDTALDINLGSDAITEFGKSDILVTTTAIYDGNKDGWIAFGADKAVDLAGGVGSAGDTIRPGEAGHIAISDAAGITIGGLEFDGAILHDGVNYYVYSLGGSAAGMAELHF